MELLTVRDLAVLLRVCERTAYDLVRGGVVPSIRVGRQHRIPSDALDRWVERQSTATREPQGA